MKRQLIAIAALALATGLSDRPAYAQEVRLVADDARGALKAASLLLSLDEEAAPQDYIAAARADYRRLLTALYAEGYYSGTVSITVDGREAAAIAPLDAPREIGSVVISVDPGEQFTFGRVQLAPLPPGTSVATDLGPRQPARSGEIQAAVSGVATAWRDLGYAKVTVADQRITARHEARELDVSVTFDTGPRLRFGDLSVTGNATVSDDRVREIAGLPVGDVFSPADLETVARRLRRTGTQTGLRRDQIDVRRSRPPWRRYRRCDPRQTFRRRPCRGCFGTAAGDRQQPRRVSEAPDGAGRGERVA